MEYYIMPIVNIGLEIKEKYNDWDFGENVIKSLEDCKSKYYTKTYGKLNVDGLPESHRLRINALKDYGMIGMLQHLNEEMLIEIEKCLNVRYSTIDVLKAINTLSTSSGKYRDFFRELKRKYMV